MSWLKRDLVRVGRFRLKVHHLLSTIVLCAIVFVIGLLVGWWLNGYTYPYRTLPRPPLPPGQKAPGSSCKHTMGGCLPKPKAENAAAITATTQGPDFSNNNPVYGTPWVAIGRKNAFAIFKVSEGTGYVDPTAKTMAAYAKSQGLVVGGYDFLHVCADSAVGEAELFASHLKADGLTGAKTLPPIADAEYDGTGCDARSWMASWYSKVKALLGRTAMTYTGAWWWQPHLGAWWPGTLAWVSGYGVSYPYMPSGRSKLDMWQFADNGFNGYNSADLSQWRDGASAFYSATQTTVKPSWWAPNLKKLDKTRRKLSGRNIDERDSVRVWVQDHCLEPVRRAVCKRIKIEAGLEKARIDWVAGHGAAPKYRKLVKPDWSKGEPGSLGLRNQDMQKVLTMTKGV